MYRGLSCFELPVNPVPLPKMTLDFGEFCSVLSSESTLLEKKYLAQFPKKPAPDELHTLVLSVAAKNANFIVCIVLRLVPLKISMNGDQKFVTL